MKLCQILPCKWYKIDILVYETVSYKSFTIARFEIFILYWHCYANESYNKCLYTQMRVFYMHLLKIIGLLCKNSVIYTVLHVIFNCV